jgi:hypothetical protein
VKRGRIGILGQKKNLEMLCGGVGYKKARLLMKSFLFELVLF